MKKLAILPIVAMLGSAFATPSFADLKADYLAACLGASNENTELCTCKADEAVKYADDEMLGYIITATYLPLLMKSSLGAIDPLQVWAAFGLGAAPSCFLSKRPSSGTWTTRSGSCSARWASCC